MIDDDDAQSDNRHDYAAQFMPAEWDGRAFGLAGEIRGFLASIKDQGTAIDSGGGDGTGDLWVTIDGVEYFISVRKSNKQLHREGRPLPTA